jgi:serine protease AprX
LHRPGVQALADRIREIERKRRPARSLSEKDERQFVEHLECSLSDDERAELEELRGQLDERLDTMRKAVSQAVARRASANRRPVANLVRSLGGTLNHEIALTNAVAARIPSPQLGRLAEHPRVARMSFDALGELRLDVSVPTTGFRTWWNQPDPIDGGAFDVGIVDSGVQQDHPALTGHPFYTNSGRTTDTRIDGHGTHVTGIIASSNSLYRGGAFGLDAIIWALTTNASTTMSNLDWMMNTSTGPFQHPEAINQSAGWGTVTVDYTAEESFYDAFIDNYNVMVAISADNSGWGATTTITHPDGAYNPLIVANMNDRGTSSRSDDVRASTSGVGPTVGGRRKPDISAPGTNIMSTNNNWAGVGSGNPDPNCWQSSSMKQGYDFVRCSGTSMAAPHVTAGLLLTVDGGNYDHMAQKAVLLNTADAWTSWDTQTTADDGPVQGSLWDKSYGWGYLDMAEAHFNRGDYFLDSVVRRNDNALDDDYKLYKGRMFANEKATLVWQKRASTYVAGGAATGQHPLSDLNIRLYDEADGSLDDFDLDGNDNVHQVAANELIDAVIKVYAWSTDFSGTSSEEFALATEENFVAASPPTFRRNYSRPNWVGPAQSFQITARIFNDGDVAANGNLLTLQGIPGVGGTGARSVASIPGAGGVQETVYTLTTSGLGAGTHWLPIEFESQSYDETYRFSTSQGVSLVVETTPAVGVCTSAPASQRGGTIPVGWAASDSQTGVLRTYLYVREPGSSTFAYAGVNAGGTSGTFDYGPSANGTYQFALRSVDHGGNWEAMPTAAECSTSWRPRGRCGLGFELAALLPLLMRLRRRMQRA